MGVNELSVFETVSEVTDYVQVQLNDPSFTSLRFLRNLRLIQGRRTARYSYSPPIAIVACRHACACRVRYCFVRLSLCLVPVLCQNE